LAVWLRCSLLTGRCGHVRRSRLASHPKALSRGAAGYFNRLLKPGAWSVAPPPRLNVDLVMNTALCVKTLQVRRQQGGSRELHRFWCWPRRSSHGRDHLGYQPCTLTPRPAPKSTATLPDIDLRFPSSYCFSGNGGAKFSKKVRMACAQHAENVDPVFAAGSPAVRRDESVSPRRPDFGSACAIESDARTHRTPTPKVFASPALRARNP
jgi:hypothetical protein